tara:strand:- start:1 stop:942 length:942 start_codon:yes stop_codon:yes gene_type:complete
MKIQINSEFASEIVLAVPYAYWLHMNGNLESVTTSIGMKPFYYFCDNVKEEFQSRTVNNSLAGLTQLPNDWIHHNAKVVTGTDYGKLSEHEQTAVNGVLDYSQWTAPQYEKIYNDYEFKELGKKYIVVNNNYNIEYGRDISKSKRYFNIESLYHIFNILTDKGYTIVYKRPNNTEFTIDENEQSTLHQGLTLTADVDQLGEISDYDLCDHYANVIKLQDLSSKYDYEYNELQLRINSNASGFITPNGGGGILCGYFSAPIAMHVTAGKELRPNYLTNKNSYFGKLSNNTLHPVIDEDNQSNYKKLLNKIKDIF